MPSDQVSGPLNSGLSPERTGSLTWSERCGSLTDMQGGPRHPGGGGEETLDEEGGWGDEKAERAARRAARMEVRARQRHPEKRQATCQSCRRVFFFSLPPSEPGYRQCYDCYRAGALIKVTMNPRKPLKWR